MTRIEHTYVNTYHWKTALTFLYEILWINHIHGSTTQAIRASYTGFPGLVPWKSWKVLEFENKYMPIGTLHTTDSNSTFHTHYCENNHKTLWHIYKSFNFYHFFSRKNYIINFELFSIKILFTVLILQY